MSTNTVTSLRWGIIATGQISSWFVRDLALSRQDASAKHMIHAIGSSSKQKGLHFVQEFIPDVSPSPKVYGSYDEVYADPGVDIIYVGTPHGFHKKNCLDAIEAGKHVLCEKAFALNTRDAREVFAAAKEKGVFIMEAMWTRFFPLVQTLQKLIHKDKVIGDVHRVFCDLGLDMDIASLDSDSRLKNPALGAGTLLDICIYSLTWGLLSLDPACGDRAESLRIAAIQTLSDSVDVATAVLLLYPSTGKQAICTSTNKFKTSEIFCRIEGTNGHITVEGVSASAPSSFTVYPKISPPSMDGPRADAEPQGRRYEHEHPGFGLFWEADAVARDIACGRTESEIMPWAETLRMMSIMDEVRRQGGARYPVDEDWI